MKNLIYWVTLLTLLMGMACEKRSDFYSRLINAYKPQYILLDSITQNHQFYLTKILKFKSKKTFKFTDGLEDYLYCEYQILDVSNAKILDSLFISNRSFENEFCIKYLNELIILKTPPEGMSRYDISMHRDRVLEIIDKNKIQDVFYSDPVLNKK